MPTGIEEALILSALVSGGMGIMGASSANKGAKAQAREIERHNKFLEALTTKYEGIADPFRQAIYPQLESILRGDTDISSTPLYGVTRDPLEEQFKVARSELEGRTGVGGGTLSRLLADLEMRRATTVGSIPGQLYGQYLNAGLGLASGKPEMAVGAVGAMNQGSGALLDYYGGQAQAGYQMTGQAGGQLGNWLYDQYMKGGSGGTPSATSYSALFQQPTDPYAGYNLPNLQVRR